MRIAGLLGFACPLMGMAEPSTQIQAKERQWPSKEMRRLASRLARPAMARSGEGMASIAPRLAGLSKTYILNQLTAFSNGRP